VVVLEQAGWIEALVRDQAGAPVTGVWICFDVDGDENGEFTRCHPTGGDGTAIEAVEHGRRRVWLDLEEPLPNGYAHGGGVTERTVEVVEDDTVQVQFGVLKR
jgi:hypothetical protein